MGNYKCRREGYLLGWEIDVAEMMFRGESDTVIIKTLWPEVGDDKKKMQVKRDKLTKLRRKEKFQEYYRSIISEWSLHHVGKALNKLAEQIDSDKPWVANKAANDVILHSKAMITGTDDNTVVVKVEGMPELGTPEEDNG